MPAGNVFRGEDIVMEVFVVVVVVVVSLSVDFFDRF